MTPDQKLRIVRALQARGATVGFMGDGINDAPAIRAADVGLSVDGATDVAREAADMILLDPDLSVLAAGVEEGRRTYANIMKYIRMGTSSNFGNMLTMAIASVFLPFLPLTAVQVLPQQHALRSLADRHPVRSSGCERSGASARLGYGRAGSIHLHHGPPFLRLRHRDLCRPSENLPCRCGDIFGGLVHRVNGDADSLSSSSFGRRRASGRTVRIPCSPRRRSSASR